MTPFRPLSPTTRPGLLPVLLVLLSCAGAAEAEPVLVAHPSVERCRLSLNTTRLIFGMQLGRWTSGEPVRVFVLPDDSREHRTFAKNLLRLYPGQLRRVWDRRLHSGTGQAPETVSDQAEMREKIASTPGAIGYLTSEMIDDRVHVLAIR